MPEIIYKVFVSSTYEDLREERAELQKALLRLNALPVGMELFPSADYETWDFIKEQIDDSDYYAVVVAGRYGPEYSDGLSFTEKEYDYARERGKRVIAFLHADPNTISVGKTDTDAVKREKLAKFIEKIRKSPVNLYRNPHELAAQVTASFVYLRQRHPAVGFVRADQSVDPMKHITLLEENARLKEQLAALVRQPAIFPDAQETIQITLTMEAASEVHEPIVVTDTWVNIFRVAAESIIDGDTYEYDVRKAIVKNWIETGLFKDDPELIDDSPNFSEIKRHLFRLGLVDFTRRGNEQYWYLTEYGRQQYALLPRGP